MIYILLFALCIVFLFAILFYGDGIGKFIDAAPDPYFWPNVVVNRFRRSHEAICDHCIMRDNCGIYNTKPVVLLTQIEECNRQEFYGGKLK